MELEQTKARVTELEEALEQARDACKHLEGAKEAAEREASQIGVKVQELTKQLADARAEVQKLQSQLRAAEAKTAGDDSALRTQLDEVLERERKANAELRDAVERADLAEEHKSDLNRRLTVAEEARQEAETQLTEERGKLAEAQRQLTEAQAKLATATKQNQDWGRHNDLMKMALVSAGMTHAAGTASEITALADERDGLKNKVSDLETQVADKDSEIARLAEEIKDMRSTSTPPDPPDSDDDRSSTPPDPPVAEDYEESRIGWKMAVGAVFVLLFLAAGCTAAILHFMGGGDEGQTEGKTEDKPEPAAGKVTYTKYPATRENLALFFFQDVDPEKFNGRISPIAENTRHIRCENGSESTVPPYDKDSDTTDVSGCKIYVPAPPGMYEANKVTLRATFGQDDPTCVIFPRPLAFHSFSENAVGFACGDKNAHYYGDRNCFDISECRIRIPEGEKE
ncbi:MAG: hypothetical protein ACOYUZ_05845 [Patescibacteria group bacterium]